jgi:nitrate/TMAO reductase-like tetraheme cytochrome c subunit
MRFKERFRRFFNPPAGSPRWMLVLPYAVLGILLIGLLIGGAYGWEYTNSPQFCGTTCHTMPPQNATYIVSPHANVYCTECHIGRAFVGQQLARKTEDVYEVYSMVFHAYEFPIRATRTKPDVLTCEKCHLPETFSDDSLRTVSHFANDIENTMTTTYLVLKTGGGTKREGLGRGIHWHIVNPILYYSGDIANQVIPYVRVMNDDGTYTEYVDVESDFNPATVDESKLKAMECTTCHNRVSHNFKPPEASVDEAMARGLISPEIPGIHQAAVDVLSASYETHAAAMQAIDGVEEYYKTSDNYAGHADQISQAVETIKAIYDRTFFPDQKVDWTTHPNNIGHISSPGCFRCHDGKHLDAENQAIRLECNVCHSIPVVVGSQDFIANIEISRGPEPESHRNPNWISLHNQVFDSTCASCHTTEDPGGTSNGSFCSNSACHGNVYTYAGFDAPALREILKDQLPPPPTPAAPAPSDSGNPTFESFVGPLFESKCTVCHSGSSAQKGLDLSSYAGVMEGGESGPAIVSGDSAGSLLVQVQSDQHFATFSEDELEVIKNWINNGAPEN